MPAVRERNDQDPDESWRHLTPRETEVFKLLNQGKSNKEIGSALFITERTAKCHVANILHKKRVATRIDLFRIAQVEQEIYGLSGC